MMNTNDTLVRPRCHNRIAAIALHSSRYSFRGTSRLAKDCGVAKSTICQLIHGRTAPLYATLEKIVSCLEYQLARKLPTREVISFDGSYPTPFVCALVGCSGCLPEFAFQPDGSLKPEWENVAPGRWSGDLCEEREGAR